MLVSTHYMDEAERCHGIAYIAYGHLLAHGTVDEVIAQIGICRAGPCPARAGLASELAGKPGVDMVAPFGTTLHVSGRTRRRWKPPSRRTATERSWGGSTASRRWKTCSSS